jgi:hypothetical protein
MPNEVSNRVTITNESEIDQILHDIHKEIPHVTIDQQSNLGIRIQYITAWEPNIQFLEKIVENYPLSWVKNEWSSEDGTSGIIIGKKNDLKTMSWNDLSIDDENHFFNT